VHASIRVVYARTKRKSKIWGIILRPVQTYSRYNYFQRKINIPNTKYRVCAKIISIVTKRKIYTGAKRNFAAKKFNFVPTWMNFNLDWSHSTYSAIKYSSSLCPSTFTDDIQGHRGRSNADDTFQVVILSSFDLLCKSTDVGSLTVQWNEKLWSEAVPRANRAV